MVGLERRTCDTAWTLQPQRNVRSRTNEATSDLIGGHRVACGKVDKADSRGNRTQREALVFCYLSKHLLDLHTLITQVIQVQ